MPQQTVYIRNSDMEKWKALEHKSRWISRHLNKLEVSSVPSEPKVRYARQATFEERAAGSGLSIELGNSVDGVIEENLLPKVAPARLANGLCKIHGTPLTNQGKCLQKGCKYA